MLTVNYPNSIIKSFSMKSFYFGCAMNLLNGGAAVPTACIITFTGYKGSDNSVSDSQQVCSREFQYNPSSALGPQEMSFSQTIVGCTEIQFGIFTFSPPGGSAATAPDLGLALDGIVYETCQ
jgi:hypothetical protein